MAEKKSIIHTCTEGRRKEIGKWNVRKRYSHRKARCEMCWPGVKADQRERDENRREEQSKLVSAANAATASRIELEMRI